MLTYKTVIAILICSDGAVPRISSPNHRRPDPLGVTHAQSSGAAHAPVDREVDLHAPRPRVLRVGLEGGADAPLPPGVEDFDDLG